MPVAMAVATAVALSANPFALSSGQEVPPADDTPAAASWPYIATKAVSFEALSSALETGLFVALYGTAGVSAGTVFAVSLATASAAYVAHEYAWDYLYPPSEGAHHTAVVLGKTVTWRIVSTARSFVFGNVLGGPELAASAIFAVSVAAADTVLYAAHEYAFPWIWAAASP